MVKGMIAAFVQAALACWNVRGTPHEKLYAPMLEGPIGVRTNSSAPNQFTGRTTLGSGTAFVTVSTRLVNSDSYIALTPIPKATVASGQQWVTPMPMSLVEGVSFAIANVDGVGRAPGYDCCWEIRNNR